jgi:TonB family protein
LQAERAEAARKAEQERLARAEAERIAEQKRSEAIIQLADKIIEQMVKVDGGSFMMGKRSNAYMTMNEGVSITVANFNISKYEITKAQWEAVMYGNINVSDEGNLPATWISWDKAQEFISKLNKYSGKNFRLPTEIEWEYAARGGRESKGYEYSGSNNINNVAWYDGSSDNQPHTVGTKAPNELGIYDMSGNVREWCGDNSRNNKYKILCGGAFRSIYQQCTIVSRYETDAANNGLWGENGFRLAMSVESIHETQAYFPGGNLEMRQWIIDHVNYPQVKKKERVSGQVTAKFYVQKDGTISDDVQILESLSPPYDQEVIRLIRSMPKWIPGTQDGNPVQVSNSIEIKF